MYIHVYIISPLKNTPPKKNQTLGGEYICYYQFRRRHD